MVCVCRWLVELWVQPLGLIMSDAQLVSTNGERCSEAGKLFHRRIMWPDKSKAVCLSNGNESARFSSWLGDSNTNGNGNGNGNSHSDYFLNIFVQLCGQRHAADDIWRLILLIYGLGSSLWLIGRSARSVRTIPKPNSISNPSPKLCPTQSNPAACVV